MSYQIVKSLSIKEINGEWILFENSRCNSDGAGYSKNAWGAGKGFTKEYLEKYVLDQYLGGMKQGGNNKYNKFIKEHAILEKYKHIESEKEKKVYKKYWKGGCLEKLWKNWQEVKFYIAFKNWERQPKEKIQKVICLDNSYFITAARMTRYNTCTYHYGQTTKPYIFTDKAKLQAAIETAKYNNRNYQVIDITELSEFFKKTA